MRREVLEHIAARKQMAHEVYEELAEIGVISFDANQIPVATDEQLIDWLNTTKQNFFEGDFEKIVVPEFAKNYWITSKQAYVIALMGCGRENTVELLTGLYSYVIDREEYEGMIDRIFPDRSIFADKENKLVKRRLKELIEIESKSGWSHPYVGQDKEEEEVAHDEPEPKRRWLSQKFFDEAKESPRAFATAWFIAGVVAFAWVELILNSL